ncbi:MAG: dTDP-4-dehydrorhamnose 3,5-epimerase [Deltaproteobacteria bacterium]|nr:dTDP-4-dehydrorhamnose 3,5-epimerase [Deltaproteobacteria bacterium]
MKLTETTLAGAFVIELDRIEDERGMFARTFCRREFTERGLVADVAQCNVSVNPRRHTLRGMHYQTAPHQETKLVRCSAGAVYDVIVDLRPGSPTYRQWYAHTLTAEAMTALYIPADFAHGFLSLTDGATVLYQMSAEYHAESARGLRWNDPSLGIEWPAEPRVLGARDANYPLLSESHHG